MENPMKEDINNLLANSAKKIKYLFAFAATEKKSATAGEGLTDAKGRLCPLSIISPVDLAREQLLQERIERALDLQRQLEAFKVETAADIDEFIRVSNAEHAAKIGARGGKTWKGNLQLVNYNATLKINVKIADRIAFNEKLNLAMEKLNSLIAEHTTGIDDVVKALVNEAFRVDQTGSIDAKKVLALQKYNISNPVWQAAMADIKDSIQIIGSKSYLQFWRRDTPEGEWQAIPLDIARL